MYYHHRNLKYIKYGKVGPPPVEELDPHMAKAYQWLGQYCGFYPQVWLSRSNSCITGFRPWCFNNKYKTGGVLFGFDVIKGFPVDYDLWVRLLTDLGNSKSLKEANKAVHEYFESHAFDDYDPDLYNDPVYQTYRSSRNVEKVLSKHLFIKHDQVVVPQLNLKTAKTIICRNERQKKKLRQMGFIEDRISIRGIKSVI